MDQKLTPTTLKASSQNVLPRKENKSSNPVGRPTVMTPEILSMLRSAFLIGASDEEACAYAEIGKSTLYDYQNDHPEFSEQKDQWKKNPILKAKTSVIDGLKDPELALKYLELRDRDEFYKKQKNDTNLGGGLKIETNAIVFSDFNEATS